MAEIKIELENTDLFVFYGERNSNIDVLEYYFPKLKIIAKGTSITAIGKETDVIEFEKKVNLIAKHIQYYNKLDKSDLEKIIELNDGLTILSKNLILYGLAGKAIKPLTKNQTLIVEQIENNDMVFAVGPAGTGKTYTSVALAVRALKNKEVRRIILTRPAIEAGENIGFLPGDFKEKLDPYMQPLYDGLKDMIHSEKIESYIQKGIIEIAPLGFMRGRTLDEAFVILDEAQNTTVSQMKMFLTRMGKSAKFIINGDVTQVDLPSKIQSGLIHATQILKDVKGIGIVHLDESDVVRHPLVKKILKAYG
ncbi:MAG: PhoH family protein [Solirubrobacteraceae bacterium]